jgi:hypothetical protein
MAALFPKQFHLNTPIATLYRNIFHPSKEYMPRYKSEGNIPLLYTAIKLSTCSRKTIFST